MSSDITVSTVFDRNNKYHPYLRDGIQIMPIAKGFDTKEEAMAYGNELKAIHDFFFRLATANCPSPTEQTTSPTGNSPVTAR